MLQGWSLSVNLPFIPARQSKIPIFFGGEGEVVIGEAVTIQSINFFTRNGKKPRGTGLF